MVGSLTRFCEDEFDAIRPGFSPFFSLVIETAEATSDFGTSGRFSCEGRRDSSRPLASFRPVGGDDEALGAVDVADVNSRFNAQKRINHL